MRVSSKEMSGDVGRFYEPHPTADLAQLSLYCVCSRDMCTRLDLGILESHRTPREEVRVLDVAWLTGRYKLSTEGV
jgi:hypothetical protein